MTAEETQTPSPRRLQIAQDAICSVLEFAADFYFVHNASGSISQSSERATRMLGFEREELLRMNLLELLPPSRHAELLQIWQSLEPGDSQLIGIECRTKSRAEIPVELSIGATSIAGTKKLLVSLARDRSPHLRSTRATETLSSLGQRLSAIATLREAGLVILSAADDLFKWDAAFVDLYEARSGRIYNIATFDVVNGIRTETLSRHPSVLPDSNTDRAVKYGPQLILREDPASESSNAMLGDTGRYSASLMFAPIRKEPNVIGVISVQSYANNAYTPEDLHLLDIMTNYCSGAFDRILAQEQLHEAEQRFSTAFEHAPIGLGLLRPDGDWLRVNRSLCDIVGYTENQLLATGLHAITTYEDLSRSLDALLSVFAGDNNFVSFEVRLIHQTQRRVWVNLRASLVRDSAGQPLYLVAQIQDITYQRRLEQVQDAFRNLGQNLVEAKTPQDVAKLVLASAETLFGWDAAYVDLYDRDSGICRSVIMIDMIDGKKTEMKLKTYVIDKNSLAYRTLAEGAQLITGQSAAEPRSTLKFGSNRPSASLMYVPVRREGLNVGVLSIQSYAADAYSQMDLEILQELADYCSTSFERAHAEAKAAEAELALRESQRRFEWVMRATTDVIYDRDVRSGSIWWNDNIESMFGYKLTEAEYNLSWWIDHLHPDDRGTIVESMHWAIVEQSPGWSGEYRFRCSDSSFAYVYDRGHIVYDGTDAVRMIGSMMDITQRKKAEEELRRGAYHDPLTGLANRMYLLEELHRTLARSKRHDNKGVGLLFLDIDCFKEVNDSYGHLAGDQLLIEVARLLCECVRPSDLVGRLGGDEFTVILGELQSPADAEAIAKRILARLQKPVHVRSGDLQTGASIGITLSDGRNISASDLLQEADAAMYKAKAAGKNRFEFYTSTQ